MIFRSKSDDYKAPCRTVHYESSRCFPTNHSGMLQEEGELPEPLAAVLCLELLCQCWPLRYTSGTVEVGNCGIKDFFHTCWDTACCTAIDQAHGQSCDVSYLLSSHQPQSPVLVAKSCPPSTSFTKGNFPDATQSFWALECFGTCCAEVRKSWVLFSRCIGSPSPKQRKVFIMPRQLT